ncbi:helix-turn-helix domain-containing protein [Flavobacterium sp. C4GT6]|uniref:helix-turn-helix domain-containing protein n=1 Tax=Flavobacterium sp. C4GT6 TaxID=3103818 RepID=UPI002ED41BE3
MMQQSTILNQVSPEDLHNMIIEGVKTCLKDLSNYLQPKKPDELLTREEAAKKLKISISTLNNWVGKGILQTYGIGGRVYLKNSEIEQAMVKLN